MTSLQKSRIFKSYIYKVLKQVHPDTGISNVGMAVVNDYCYDVFRRLLAEVSQCAFVVLVCLYSVASPGLLTLFDGLSLVTTVLCVDGTHWKVHCYCS
jgi:hypothetical protein